MIDMFMIVNFPSLPVLIFEPSSDEKRKKVAAAYGLKKTRRTEIEELKSELRSLREKARKDIRVNVEKFKELALRVPWLNLHEVDSPKDFLRIFKKIVPRKYPVSLNKSNIVVNEIRPYLRNAGYRTYIRYFSEFESLSLEKKVFKDYYMLPGLHDRNLIETFELKRAYDLAKSKIVKEYCAILSANAATLENGSFYFLQHMSNISKDLEEARVLFLLVGIEKIVETKCEAETQLRAIGVFGLEPAILDLKARPGEIFDFYTTQLSSGRREVHVVLFNNRRGELLSTDYEDLLLCIDCRACARQCPVGQHLDGIDDLIYSPKNMLLLSLQGSRKPFEACLHCGRCEIECPVGIRLPELMWRFQIDYQRRKGFSLRKLAFDNPEFLARLGGMLSPFSNLILRIPPMRFFMQIFPGIHRKANLPKFHRETFRDWLDARGKD